MRHYVDDIVTLIKNGCQNNSGKYLFRLEHFPTFEIYEDVCYAVRDFAHQKGFELNGKLSNEKFKEFQISTDSKKLDKFILDGFYDPDSTMTKWRNKADFNGIILLMGTELVQDKGGLADFYLISPKNLNESIGSKYSKWFKDVIDTSDKNEEKIINTFFNKLFSVVPKDLLKMSNIIERLEKEQVFGAENIINVLGKDLWNDWRVPCIKSFTAKQITSLKNGKFDLFEKAFSFLTRADYRDITQSTFKKLENQFAKFFNEKTDLLNDNELEISANFKSREGFKVALINYLKGQDVDNLREKLCSLDFNFLNEILKIKLPREKKESVKTISGAPFDVFSQMIIETINNFNVSDEDIEFIEFEIDDVVLARPDLSSQKSENNTHTIDSEILKEWNKLCRVSFGLIDFLNLSIESKVLLKYKEEQDPFIVDNLVDTPIRFSNNTTSKIKIRTKVNGIDKYKNDFTWSFSPEAYWLNIFEYIYVFTEDEPVLPIFYTKELGDLLTSEDETIFLMKLKESDVKAINVWQSVLKVPNKITTSLFQFVKSYKEFIDQLKQGFYTTVLDKYGYTASRMINDYCESLNKLRGYFENGELINSEIESIQYVTNLFTIFDSKKEGVNEIYHTGAIVTPFHPTMIEKIIAKQEYKRNGLTEIIEGLLEDKFNLSIGRKKLDRHNTQSKIISAVEIIASENNNHLLPKSVYGYYTLYGDARLLERDVFHRSRLLDSELIYDEDFNTSDIISESSLSNLIFDQINTYINTFPTLADSLTISFINFKEIQPIVSGLHQLSKDKRIKSLPYKKRIIINLISPPNQSGKGYLNFWLDNFFSEEDSIQIETYYSNFDLKNENLKREIVKSDVIFLKDILDTSGVSFRKANINKISPSEARFPMVFNPMPSENRESERRVSISQKQFQASFEYSQLIHRVCNPNNVPGIYRIDKMMKLDENVTSLIEYLHEKSNWVVIIDSALDKKLLNQDYIISFTTGEGSFGELNLTVSAPSKVKDDISNKVSSRLKKLFTYWDVNMCQQAAQSCINKSTQLDGVQVLKALNPFDYEVHNFLAYILSFETIKDNPKGNLIVKSYLPLDNYQHWFIGTSTRPDFLLLEVYKDGIRDGSSLVIKGTLIECKIANQNEQHVAKGKAQLSEGLMNLKSLFNPNSVKFNRRYWYSQLYRALVFGDMVIDERERENINIDNQLLKILDGNFEVDWSARLLTYWIDWNGDFLRTNTYDFDEFSITHEEFGQLYIQQKLLDGKSLDKVRFQDTNSVEFEIFADNSDDFGEKIEKYDKESIMRLFVEDGNKNNEPKNEDKGKLDSNDDDSQSSTNNDFEQIKKDLPSLDPNDGKENEDQKANNYDKDDSDVESKYPSLAADGRKNYGDIALENIRILLGEDVQTREKIYWEYGHPELENRHILISGKSGVGKTYFIQCLLLELSRCGISSIIFDYTDGFKTSKLEEEFKEMLGDKIVQFYIKTKKFPINPFKRNKKELDEGIYELEDNVDVAERMKSVFTAVLENVGDQQSSAIYRATMSGLEKYGDAMNLKYLGQELQKIGTSNALSMLSKMQHLIDRNPFDSTSDYDWEKHRENKGIVFVVQLSGYPRDFQMMVTEFILWDLWNFNLSHGDKTIPFPVILDEAQNLDHRENSPSAKILTEGRKFGWSGWYATQFMEGQMRKDEIQRLQNAGQKVYFAPPEQDINNIASYLSTNTDERNNWKEKLAKLNKGHCIVAGPSFNPRTNKLEKRKPRIIKVSPLSERE